MKDPVHARITATYGAILHVSLEVNSTGFNGMYSRVSEHKMLVPVLTSTSHHQLASLGLLLNMNGRLRPKWTHTAQSVACFLRSKLVLVQEDLHLHMYAHSLLS